MDSNIFSLFKNLMKTPIKAVLLSIFIGTIVSVQAEPSKYSDTISFDKIEVDTLINTFIQDSDGFFWIGGDDGLYKFDGYTFKHYTPVPVRLLEMVWELSMKIAGDCSG